MTTSEEQLITWLQNSVTPSPHSIVSIGDDAALLRTGSRGILVATDMLLEGRHFNSTTTPPHMIGRKAIGVNLSDIAAMGGTPNSVFISLGIPRGISMEWLQSMMLGAQDLCAEFGCGIDGGDTNSWDGGLVINVTITGTPHVRGIATRSGAQAGDVVMVSGQSLGGSLMSGRHLSFTPRVREAQWLMDHFTIHSMMDLSDGLATDLARMAIASQKQFILDAAAIAANDNELRQALCDGEDFELVFTCDQATAKEIETNSRWSCGFRRVGRVAAGSGIVLDCEGSLKQLPAAWRGWIHPIGHP